MRYGTWVSRDNEREKRDGVILRFGDSEAEETMVTLAEVGVYRYCVSIELNVQFLDDLVYGETNDWVDGG